MSAKSSGAQPNGTPNGDTKSRTHHDGSSGRAFTVEQKAAVIRVKRCKPTDFYDILGLEEVRSSCTDSEIKKAYRKLSLLTHPDKNGYPGADDAFKMVSRAFQILSDAEKKQKYDKFGGDPDNRFSGMGGGGGASASPFSGFASQRGPARGPMFEEEISPEELFRQFFGGGMGGGPFGGMGGFGGPGFVFNMGGGPGVRIHQFGGNRPRRRPHNHETGQRGPTGPMETLRSLLPLLLLFVLPLLSSLFTGSGSSGPKIFMGKQAQSPYTMSHTSDRLSVPYWVNPADVTEFTPKKWKELDKVAEGQYVGQLSAECEWENNRRQQLANDAQGFFFTDQIKLDLARQMERPSCTKLASLPGYSWR
ncbi:Chaperone protein dnaJ [Saxophila tyrrhenica]|uniref:Chaperone protein dnaJ n=1 Tax=Saxophila tyrrhenica TaxID=1690608 RepID=A0AAV9PFJ1_9PEZI|nr:Chaperone protein dnaJ [Saxophila tyrrhenica]